ncbi:MAG TPA: hypothetical protein VJV75_13340 [Candidatus Polarisedimenticolia bacterium]|nr:hypothetical protein [Candidatus Polarisedimenticolia bacterium]
MRRVGLTHVDPDPKRATQDRDLVDSLNAMVGVTVTVTTPQTADTEFAVRHPELGKIASEVHILMQDAPGYIYRSSPPKWTKEVSFFKYSAAGGHRLTLRIR